MVITNIDLVVKAFESRVFIRTACDGINHLLRYIIYESVVRIDLISSFKSFGSKGESCGAEYATILISTV